MNKQSDRQVLAATFATPDGATRAAAALTGALAGKIGNTAVSYVKPSGDAKFVESKDWGAGRGAVVGGLLGLIIGPLGALTGGALGGLAAKLRDSGFDNGQLDRLGRSLQPDHSALVVEISPDAVETAIRLLDSLNPQEVATVDIDANLATVFSQAESVSTH